MRVLVVSDNQGVTYPVMQSLNALGHTVYLGSRHAKDWNKYSRFCEGYVRLPVVAKIQDNLNAVREYVQENKIDFILPISVRRISMINKICDELTNVTIALTPTDQTIDITNDKTKFHSFCNKNDFKIPDEITAEKASRRSGVYYVKDGNKTFQTTEETVINATEGSIIQKYVEGTDIDCSFLAKDGEMLDFVFQKNYKTKNTVSGSPVVLQMVKPKKVIVEQVRRMIKILNYSGVGHIDMRIDDEQNLTFFELNPRFWLTLQFAKIHGFDVVKALILASTQKKYTTGPKSKDRRLYFTNTGIKQASELGFSEHKLKQGLIFFNIYTGDTQDL